MTQESAEQSQERTTGEVARPARSEAAAGAHQGPHAAAGPPAGIRKLFARRVRDLVRREALFPPGCRVLAMVSGGQDSVAMLHLMATGALGKVGPGSLRALHVNHHLRGSESDDDQALVERLCQVLGVELVVVHRPVAKRGNVQEAAREARREAALAAAEEWGASRIALGHTLDDQVETLLYRLGRYGGLAAFRGMLPCDPPWVRPLLECRRSETAAYCEAAGLAFADDRGNRYPGYARTAIREQVLPAWEGGLPGAVRAAGRAAAVAAEIEQLVREQIAAHWSAVGVGDGCDKEEQPERTPGGAEGERGVPEVVRVSALKELTVPLRRVLLHAWLEVRARPAASRASVLAVEELLGISGSASRDLGGGWRAQKVYDDLRLEKRGPLTRRPGQWARVGTGEEAVTPAALAGSVSTGSAATGSVSAGSDSAGSARADQVSAGTLSAELAFPGLLPAVPLPVPGAACWGDWRITASLQVGVDAARYQHPEIAHEAFVDARCLVSPVEVRGPRPGDRIRPLGSPGSRKLQDVLVDRKVPRAARARLPLVVAGGRIIWVGGLVVSEEGRITGETETIVRLELQPLEAVASGQMGEAE